MNAGIKNVKHHTINIYITGILLILFSFNFQNLFSSAKDDEKKWVIVIDPGHGGKDPGSIGSFTKEKNINLAIALRTGKYLEANIKNLKVIYTRNDDSTVDLMERPKIANRNNADLFISIHSNWWKVKTVIGAETFIMGPTKDEANLAVAMKENEVLLQEDDYTTKYAGFDPKSPESYIMFSLMQNVFQKQSTNLAQKIQTQFTERVSRQDRGVKQAGFWVLFNTTMPAVLVETGFISNLAEEKFLSTPEGQDYMASAIYRACREYIDEIDSRSVILTDLKRDTAKSTKTEIAPQEIPEPEIQFMVQVAGSNVKIDTNSIKFRGLKDITEFNVKGRYKYASGKFLEYNDAVNYRKEILKRYPDAFVIAVKDYSILPLQEALNLKKKNKIAVK
jgi:N-acetylmuramoyl-L-alanine amidase